MSRMQCSARATTTCSDRIIRRGERASITLSKKAANQRIPTIGVGDGGNEIGIGALVEAVHKYVPYGEILCAQLATDVLLSAGVSNWGRFGFSRLSYGGVMWWRIYANAST